MSLDELDQRLGSDLVDLGFGASFTHRDAIDVVVNHLNYVILPVQGVRVEGISMIPQSFGMIQL
jgi:hypothetical protein